jgi:hypothetical protein
MSPAKKLALVKNSPARVSAPKGESSEPLTILDSKFKWTPPGTDIRERFKAMGWKAPKPKKPQFGK